MGHIGTSNLTLSLALCLLTLIGVVSLTFPAHAASPYNVGAFPNYSQEGSTITIVLTVSGASGGTDYEFVFNVRDPSGALWPSNPQRYRTFLGQTEFSVIILYPSPEFPGGASTSLVGISTPYLVWVDQTSPLAQLNVARTFFFIGLVDKTLYQRTETVSIVATGYSPLEPVTVTIRTAVSLTLVHSHVTNASNTGQVVDYWAIPKDAALEEDYVATLTGTSTAKNPPDVQAFKVQAATMSIPTLSSSQSIFQRTETMRFSFQPVYPSGEIASTGLGVVMLARPDGTSITLPASYDSGTQSFVSNYKTSTTNQTGTWTASLLSSYDDGFGNRGPTVMVSTSTQLQPATISISITTKTTFAVEPIRFNATIQYPDGSTLQTGNVTATLYYSGGGYTVPIPAIFDTALQLWVGNYNPQGDEPSGLWSLTVSTSDSALPANSGSSTRAITIQNRPPVATFTSSTSSALTGISIGFDATGSSDSDGSIVSYLWTFGDGSTGSGTVVSHTYAIAGTFTVLLTVSDNGGAPASASATVTIQNRPPTATLTSPPTTGQTGRSISFDATGSSDPDGTIVSYIWDFGDGSSGLGATTSHSYTTPGTYTVRLTITDNTGSTASTTSPITVSPAPQENVSFPLFYFGLIAAALATALAGTFLAFRKHKVTHANLKIDLEAVRSEAGRIENQEFFQSVREQLKKDKEGSA